MRASDLIRELQCEIGIHGDREVLTEIHTSRYDEGVIADDIVYIKVEGDHFILSSVR